MATRSATLQRRMYSWLHNIRNGWLDPETADPLLLFRQRAVLLITTLLGSATIPLLINDLLKGEYRIAAIELTSGLFTLVVYALLYWTRRPSPAGNVTLSVIWCCATAISISGQGLASTAVFYYLLLPLVGGLMFGTRGVVVWGGLGLLGLGGLSAGHLLGGLPGRLSDPDVAQHLLDTSVLLLLSTVATHAFLFLQQQTLDRMQDALDALAEENQQRRQAEQTQARFLATMSHELRTPLSAVVGASGLLADTPLSDEQRLLLSTTTDSASTLLSLINNVLDYSRLQAGSMHIEALPVQIRPLVQQTTAAVRLLAVEKGLSLSVEIAPSVPAWIRTDPTRLQQVLINLTGNAVKFTERGEVCIRLHAQQGSLVLSVQDTGIGISPADRDRLFQPFVQADAGTSRRFGGTGLGLSIVARLVSAMSGELALTSALGEGSCFTVTLPLTPAEPPEAAPAPVRQAAPMRILLVDDHPLNRLITARMLTADGHEVVEATDGAACLEALGQQAFSAVLMDCQMPVMDGLSATRAIREMPGDTAAIPIIGLSASADPQSRQAALRAGMDAYLAKPVDRRTLQETLAQLGR